MYRICKSFEFQAAHVLSKHPGRCKFPHGHNYRVQVSLVADELDENDMVCDFQALKAVVEPYLDTLDHAMLINSSDEENVRRYADNPRTVIFDRCDPSSEVLARRIFEHIKSRMQTATIENREGLKFKLNPHTRVERVRIWETSTAWAEYTE